MIKIEHLHKEFLTGENSLVALEDVSLEVDRGEIFGVVGPSGAGKSTLIRCVNLLERPTSGRVWVDGREMTALADADLRLARQKIGMIFQHFNLLSSRTVAENIAFPLEIAGIDRPERQKKAEELLDLVGLSDKASAYPAQLSGGQKQRVGIARALANDPTVLLSDEATSALDPQNTSAILALLKDLNRRLGLTILLITHEMDVVRQVCDSAAVLQAGRIVEGGKLSDLVTRPEGLLTRAFFPEGEAAPIQAGATRLAITFLGEAADQPVLSSLVRRFDVEVNIIGGSIQTIGSHRIGRLQVELTGSQVQQALADLDHRGLKVEVL